MTNYHVIRGASDVLVGVLSRVGLGWAGLIVLGGRALAAAAVAAEACPPLAALPQLLPTVQPAACLDC